jgi:hypothetical protein
LTMLKFRRVGRATVKKIGKVEVPPLGVNNYIQRSFASWREQNNCQKKWKPFLVLNAFEAGAYYIWNHVHWCLIWLGGSLWCSTFYCSDRFQMVSDHPVVGF